MAADPNRVLATIRQLVLELNTTTNPTRRADIATDLGNLWATLDDQLRTGGKLPTDWATAQRRI